jgi:hypothetical protein
MVFDRLPKRGEPALDLFLDRIFAFPEDDADLLRGQPGRVPQQQGIPLVIWQPSHEVENIPPVALASIRLESDTAEMGIGSCQVDGWSAATVRIDRRVARDAEEPRLDPAITPAEPVETCERTLERIGSEIERVRVASGPRPKVAVHRQPMLLVQQPERGRIQPIRIDLSGWDPFLDHDWDLQGHVLPGWAASACVGCYLGQRAGSRETDISRSSGRRTPTVHPASG